MSKLENKVAVITGANSGIGLASAKLFLQEGAKVVISGRRPEALEAIKSDLSGDFITVVADVANDDDNARLIKTAVDTYGKIDILFLNIWENNRKRPGHSEARIALNLIPIQVNTNFPYKCTRRFSYRENWLIKGTIAEKLTPDFFR